MSEGIVVEMTLKEAKFVTGLLNAARAQDKVDDNFVKIARDAAKAEVDLKRFADTTTKINATPLERYNSTVSKLDASLKKNLITQETYTRAINHANRELEQSTKVSHEAAGPSMASNVMGLAASWVSVQGAVQLVGDALEHAKQEAIATVDAVKQLSNVNRDLNQISSSPQELAELQKRADQVAVSSGVNREKAREALVAANNEGWGKDFEKIASSWQTIDLKSSSVVAGQVPGMFKGKISSLESVNLALAAARESRLNASDFAQAMPTAAEGAVPAGTSPEQLFSMMAAVSVKYSSAATGADRLRGFGSKLSMNKEFQGKSYLEAAEMMSKDEALREKVLGKDMETNNTLKVLIERRDEIIRLESLMKEERADSGTAASSLEIANANALVNPELKAERDIAISKNRMEVERQNRLLEKGAADEIAANKVKELLYKNNVSPTGVYIGEKAAGMSRFAGLPDYMTEAIGLGFGTMGDTNSLGPQAKAKKIQEIRQGYLSEANEINSRVLGPITPDELKASSKRSADAMERVEKLLQEQNEILKQSKSVQTDNSRNQTRTSAALPSLVK